MSFRLRVLALVALVAVTATALTAWLALRQASQQITDSTIEEREVVAAVTAYGHVHGTWEGVPSLVAELQAQTGERIRLVTESGLVVVDTDTMAGVAARPVKGPPLSANPRPVLELETESGDVDALGRIVVEEIDAYRTGVLFAACLTRQGVEVMAADDQFGVPRYIDASTPGDDEAAAQGDVDLCNEFAAGADEERQADAEAVAVCTDLHPERYPPPSWSPDGAVPTPSVPPERFSAAPPETPPPAAPDGSEPTPSEEPMDLLSCLAEVFASRTDWVAPVPLLVHLGVADEGATPVLSAAPVIAAAGLVAVLAIAGSTLFSRRVLRPVQALTHASRRFGAGDLSERVPVVGHDELAGLATSFNRMADSLQRGEERQRRLVADVAHELRTPLANLRGYLEALKDGVVRPDADLFASLHEEAVLQQRIVDDLQDLALAEAGALLYHRSRTDLGELLETCRTAHQAVAEAADVRLTAISIGPAAYVYADPDRLRQVLGNLVSNALRATGAGGSVTLTARQDGPSVVVTVMDTGTGISPAQLPHVFDRFWRADAARGRATGGSGLGLAIARQIVTDHAGTIEVASTLGVGTTFTLRLPADDPAAPPWAA